MACIKHFVVVVTLSLSIFFFFSVFKKMDMKIANVILEKYFSGPFGKEHPLSDTPKWPEPLFTRNEGLKSRHKETFRTACILAAMRNIHIEQGIEAYAVKKKASTVRRHMASAWAYQSKLVNYVTSVAAALFAPPRSEFCTVSLAPYVTRRMDKILDYSYLAAVDIKRSIMKTPSPENSAIYFFNDSGEKRLDTFKSIISGDGFKTGYGRLESLFISSDGKVVFALFNYKK